jgi:hypothetical protein
MPLVASSGTRNLRNHGFALNVLPHCADVLCSDYMDVPDVYREPNVAEVRFSLFSICCHSLLQTTY